MRIKQGVDLTGLVPQMCVASQVAEHVYVMYGSEVVITSGNDSEHRDGSQHYEGKALDIRTKHLHVTRKVKQSIADNIANRLGDQYFILFHRIGTPNEHIHMGWRG